MTGRAFTVLKVARYAYYLAVQMFSGLRGVTGCTDTRVQNETLCVSR